ncbi:hypothetical protein HHK36_032355 [Tetracentron sinense]|uniref:Uncharacterized protein n=1 Tax=Tetracentron sinense TaxID=13715 RepID=A0A835CXP7_TETSI|nr:hypothetical protein HHK36_032355 [Tetracentron sinense]
MKTKFWHFRPELSDLDGLAGERGNVEGEITLFGSHGERNGGRVSTGCFSGKFLRNSRRSRSVPAAWLEELSSGFNFSNLEFS